MLLELPFGLTVCQVLNKLMLTLGYDEYGWYSSHLFTGRSLIADFVQSTKEETGVIWYVVSPCCKSRIVRA